MESLPQKSEVEVARETMAEEAVGAAPLAALIEGGTQVLVRAVRCRAGTDKGFSKGQFVKGVLPHVRKQMITEIEKLYAEIKNQPFERQLPFVVSVLARERFLVGMTDEIAAKGQFLAGSYFKPGRKIYGTVNEAFDALEQGCAALEEAMQDGRAYAAEFVAKWLWDLPPQNVMEATEPEN